MKQTAIDEMDNMARQLADELVKGYNALKGQITHPALSHKLTGQELWQKYGPEYAQTREDPATWQQTLQQMGEADACEFSRQMELAMQEVNSETTGQSL